MTAVPEHYLPTVGCYRTVVGCYRIVLGQYRTNKYKSETIRKLCTGRAFKKHQNKTKIGPITMEYDKNEKHMIFEQKFSIFLDSPGLRSGNAISQPLAAIAQQSVTIALTSTKVKLFDSTVQELFGTPKIIKIRPIAMEKDKNENGRIFFNRNGQFFG